MIDKKEESKDTGQKIMDAWAADKLNREEMLEKTKAHYLKRIETLEEDMTEVSKLFENELNIKDNIIDQINTVKDAFIEKTKRLIIKLRIPREHLVYMQSCGKLEEFVEAKLLGQEPEAKWLL